MPNNKRILLIEDDEFIMNALVKSFKEQGYEVLQAMDGQTGLDLAIQEKPDLILLDIVLPKMDGLTVLRKLRKDPWGEKALIVMLSNLDRVDYQEKSFEQNVSRYLVKTDWTLEELTHKVVQILGE